MKKKYAVFLIFDDERDVREMHLMCDESDKEEVWKHFCAAVFAQAVSEFPNLFDDVFEVEV